MRGECECNQVYVTGQKETGQLYRATLWDLQMIPLFWLLLSPFFKYFIKEYVASVRLHLGLERVVESRSSCRMSDCR